MVGCIADVDDSQGSTDEIDDQIGYATDTLTVSPEFTWSQGQPHVPMGPTSDRVCFLTRVTGRFHGAGEVVNAYISNGSWYLGGSSQQSGIGATARCIYVPNATYYTAEYTWTQGTAYPVSIMPATDTNGAWTCFLTRMTGKFQGSGEEVRVYQSGGYWYIFGKSAQSSVSASARCVHAPGSGPYDWSQGNLATYMGSASNRSCALTRVTGNFEGSGESVHAFVSWDSWYLGGTSVQSSIGGTAYCIGDPTPPGSPLPYCGDGTCQSSESSYSCSQDCGAPLPCCTGSCFVAGTPVTLADGSSRPIEKLQVGDEVMAYDPDTGALAASPVTHTFVHPDSEGLVVVNGRLRATANHPFYANGRWVRADELGVGDSLVMLNHGATALSSDANLGRMAVSSLSFEPERSTTYNIEVANQHTYFADGLLVHNKPACQMCDLE